MGTLMGIKQLLRAPSANYTWRRLKQTPWDLLAGRAEPVKVVDVGAKLRAATYHGEPPAWADVLTLDLMPGPRVQIVCDAHDMAPVKSETVDLVYCISVLEHVRDPYQVMREIRRILKPGGLVYISVPF